MHDDTKKDDASFGENPFARLKKKDFPDARSPAAAGTGGRTVPPKAKAPKARRTSVPAPQEQENDEDARLFLSAMSAARPLGTRKDQAMPDPESGIRLKDHLPAKSRRKASSQKGSASDAGSGAESASGQDTAQGQTPPRRELDFSCLLGGTAPMTGQADAGHEASTSDTRQPAPAPGAGQKASPQTGHGTTAPVQGATNAGLATRGTAGGTAGRATTPVRSGPAERFVASAHATQTSPADPAAIFDPDHLADGDLGDHFMQAMSQLKGVAPLAGRGREVTPEPTPPLAYTAPDRHPLQDFMEGKLEFTLASTDEYVEGHVVGLDLLLVSKLQNGQFSPEAHLDLHGLNAEQAFDRLLGFMRGAYMKGLRTVLLVPGRGRNSPTGIGILREKVQDWLTQDPFRRVVLAFCTAKPTDGGAGALYVLLRKFRKNHGKVHWDRRPADPDLL